MTKFTDLRDYVDALGDLGDLRVIDREIDPQLEVGATIRLSYERRATAPLFTCVRGSARSGCRILGAPAGLSDGANPYARVALSIGLSADATPAQIVEHLAAATNRPPVRPLVVDSGARQQHILLGDRATLADFPKAVLHDGDGGPYINTWATIVARTRDGEFTSWSGHAKTSQVQNLGSKLVQ